MQLDDWSALGTAVRCRDAASVATLLAGGADVNEQFLERRRGVGRGSSALRYAVSLDEGPIVKLLLAAGARADEHFSLGGSTYTPLSLAQVGAPQRTLKTNFLLFLKHRNETRRVL